MHLELSKDELMLIRRALAYRSIKLAGEMLNNPGFCDTTRTQNHIKALRELSLKLLKVEYPDDWKNRLVRAQ